MLVSNTGIAPIVRGTIARVVSDLDEDDSESEETKPLDLGSFLGF